MVRQQASRLKSPAAAAGEAESSKGGLPEADAPSFPPHPLLLASPFLFVRTDLAEKATRMSTAFNINDKNNAAKAKVNDDDGTPSAVMVRRGVVVGGGSQQQPKPVMVLHPIVTSSAAAAAAAVGVAKGRAAKNLTASAASRCADETKDEAGRRSLDSEVSLLLAQMKAKVNKTNKNNTKNTKKCSAIPWSWG